MSASNQSEGVGPKAVNVSQRAQRKGAARASRVYGGLLLLFLLVLGVFAIGYFRLVHYERRVARHLPERFTWVARMDLEQAVLFEPVRKHVFPALDAETTLRGLADAGVLNLALDLREVQFALAPDGHWVVAVGGLFPSNGLLSEIYAKLPTLAQQLCRVQGPRLDCADGGLLLEQASDGTVLISDTTALLTESLPVSERHRGCGLRPEGAISWCVDPRVLGGFSASPTRVSGYLELDEELLVAEVRGSAGQGPVFARTLETMRGVLLASLAIRPGEDYAGERAVLSRSTITSDDVEARAEAHWTRREMEQGARSLALFLGRWKEAWLRTLLE